MIDYKTVGVDVDKIRKQQKKIEDIVKDTFSLSFLPVPDVKGHYASFVDMGDRLLAMHTDGVGTKVLVAHQLKKYDTIGIDCVAMNVNDLICVGARPFAFLDYIAIDKMDEQVMGQIFTGLEQGAREAEVAITGGETAVMRDVVICPDLIGFALATVDKRDVVLGDKINGRDVLIGLESSGVHSNGLTLARKVLDINIHGLDMLTPTKIYVKPILDIIDFVGSEIHGLAHITGGSFSKLKRIGILAGKGFILDNMPEPQKIFNNIQELGGVTDREMYRTFNMGVGFVIATKESNYSDIKNICNRHGVKSYVIGKVTSDSCVVVKKDNKKIILEEW